MAFEKVLATLIYINNSTQILQANDLPSWHGLLYFMIQARTLETLEKINARTFRMFVKDTL